MGLYLNDNSSIHSVLQVSGWLDDYENDVSHWPWPSLSPDINPKDHLQEIRSTELYSALCHIMKIQNKEISYESIILISSVHSRNLEDQCQGTPKPL